IENPRRRIVFLLARGVIRGTAGRVEKGVHFRIAVLGIIDSTLAGDKLTQIAIGSTRPDQSAWPNWNFPAGSSDWSVANSVAFSLTLNP
uniref:hypothetical protein n=1 Tax=Klebsiella aerogenes TaxID=548 RepID=UPI001953DA9F